MKKSLILCLAALMLFSAAACDGPHFEDQPEPPIVEEPNNNENDDTVEEDGPALIDVEKENQLIQPDPDTNIEGEVTPSKVLKLTFNAKGKNSTKKIPLTIDAITAPAGSTLEYDIYLANGVPSLGSFDMRFSEGTFLTSENGGTVTDAAGIYVEFTKMDLSAYAFEKWYHRSVDIPSADKDSREIQRILFAVDGIASGESWTCYYDNICVKDADGNIVAEITEDYIMSLGYTSTGDLESVLEIADDPAPTKNRYSAEDRNSVKTASRGEFKSSVYIDTTLSAENNMFVKGIYLGSQNDSYIFGREAYILYPTNGALEFYKVTDKLTLLSSVPLVSAEKELDLRWTLDGKKLILSVAGRGTGTFVDLFETEAPVSNGDDYGVVGFSGFGYAVNNFDTVKANTVTAEPYSVELGIGSFVGTSHKDSISYAVGEPMLFDIDFTASEKNVSASRFQFIITGDDGKSVTGTVDGSAGKIKVLSFCDKPGYVSVVVAALDEKGSAIETCLRYEGGAFAGITDMETEMPKPDDFDAFWDGKLAELENIEPTLLKSVTVENDEYDVYQVEIEAGEWGPTTGQIVIPKNAEPASLKLKVCFMFLGVRTADWNADPEYITFTVNAHAVENGREAEYYAALENYVYNVLAYDEELNKSPATGYFTGMLLRDVQAVRYIMQNELWNGKDLELYGFSQGGFQCLAVAGLLGDTATKAYAASPWMSDIGSGQYGRFPLMAPTDYTEAYRYIDTVYFADRITCPVEITAGMGDYACPPCGAAIVYNRLNVPKKLSIGQNQTHVPELNGDVYSISENWEN